VTTREVFDSPRIYGAFFQIINMQHNDPTGQHALGVTFRTGWNPDPSVTDSKGFVPGITVVVPWLVSFLVSFLLSLLLSFLPPSFLSCCDTVAFGVVSAAMRVCLSPFRLFRLVQASLWVLDPWLDLRWSLPVSYGSSRRRSCRPFGGLSGCQPLATRCGCCTHILPRLSALVQAVLVQPASSVGSGSQSSCMCLFSDVSASTDLILSEATLHAASLMMTGGAWLLA